MNKFWASLATLFSGTSSLMAFEKLPLEYQIHCGDKTAPTQVIEYFSLNCGKCVEFIEKEFPSIKAKYINTGEIQFSFHPEPADLTTLQLMVCLEQLEDSKKLPFLEVLAKGLMETKDSDGCKIMQLAMEMLEKPLPDLDKIEFLENTQAFQSAYQFLKQEDVVTILPTVEIDGILIDEYPSEKLLEEHIHKKSVP